VTRTALAFVACLLVACSPAPVDVASATSEQSSLPAGAASLPALDSGAIDALVPDQRYIDPDYAAQAAGIAGDPLLYLAWSDSALAAKPDDVELRLERAFQRARVGQVEGSIADYETLLARDDVDPFLRRRIEWYYGWSLWSMGRDAEALYRWRSAERAHGGQPEWVPYTYALALWRLGKTDVAVKYFGAAQATDPRWGTAQGLKRRTERWDETERRIAVEVQDAWRARR